MAYATALTIAALAATAIGTGVSVYSSQQQAKSQEYAADYNNKLAQQEARNAELEGQERASRMRVQKRREMARLRNELSNTGTLANSGTPLSIIADSAASMDTSINDAYRVTTMQANSARSQGTMGLWEASQARTAANLNSAAIALKGAGSIASGGYDYYRQGAFTTRTKRTT